MPEFRWRLAADDGGQSALFPEDEIVRRRIGTGEFRGLEFYEVNAQRIINEVPPASRLPFRHTINAYRGCSHACRYCFARPTHEYLGFGIGEDFDRKIVVKLNAVEKLRAELRSSRWRGDHIAMGTNTDPYQRCEGKYHLTQGIIEVLGEVGNPFSILTKSTLVLRDVDRLVEAARRTEVRVNFSIGTLDEEVWKLTEPGTPHPKRRVGAVAKLNEAGIPCGVLVAPVIPGLSDDVDHLREVIEAVVEAGAASVSVIGLHLRPGVREHFMAWLAERRPDLLEEYKKRYRRGAYLPTDEQGALSDLVHKLVDDARGRFVRPSRTRVVDGAASLRDRLRAQGIGEPEGAAPLPPPVAAAAEQLDFGLGLGSG